MNHLFILCSISCKNEKSGLQHSSGVSLLIQEFADFMYGLIRTEQKIPLENLCSKMDSK